MNILIIHLVMCTSVYLPLAYILGTTVQVHTEMNVKTFVLLLLLCFIRSILFISLRKYAYLT